MIDVAAEVLVKEASVAPRIQLDAERVVGGLADKALQIAAGSKLPGLKPDVAKVPVPWAQAACRIQLDPDRVLGGLADAATQAAAGKKPLGFKPMSPNRG